MDLIAAIAAAASLAVPGAQASSPAMQQSAAACPATPAPLPPELAGWRRMVPTAAGASAQAAPALAIGVGARVTLRPAADVAYAVAPAKAGAPVSHGGLLGFSVVRAGRYRVALGSGAWVDVVRAGGGGSLASVAHAHGPACSGVHKLVDFDLSPGRYLLQIAGDDAAEVAAMVVAVPR